MDFSIGKDTFNVALYYLNFGISLLIPLVTFSILSRVLPIETFGKLLFAQSWGLFLAGVMNSIISQDGVRTSAKHAIVGSLSITKPESALQLKLRRLTFLCMCITYTSAIFLAPSSLEISLIFVFALSSIFQVLTADWMLIGRERFGYLVMRSIVAKILGLALIAWLGWMALESELIILYPWIMILFLSGGAIFNIFKFLDIKNTIPKIPKVRLILSDLSYFRYFILIGVFSMVYGTIDVILLRYIVPISFLTEYTLFIKLVVASVALLNVFIAVIQPKFIQKNALSEISGKDITTVFMIYFLICLCSCFIAYYLLDDLILLFMGKNFPWVVSIAAWIIPIGLAMTFTGFIYQLVLIPRGLEEIYFRSLFFSGVSYVLALMCFPLSNGFDYAIYPVLIASILQLLFLLVSLRKDYEKK
jgi:O-antigen/teichoic acid export membrane protein